MNVNTIKKKLNLVREYIFPVGCAICGDMLLDQQDAYFGLCPSCAAQFNFTEETRCCQCGKPLISEREKCISCRSTEEAPEYDKLAVLYPYVGKERQLLTAYKFGSHRCLGNYFAEKITSGIQHFFNTDARNTIFVPVPPRPKKIKETGWDQIENIARVLEQNNFVVCRCLKRLASKSQKQLDRNKRKTNLVDKIKCVQTPPLSVVVFDDVFTTGSTMNVCAGVLKNAGAKEVKGLCLFYD